MAATMSAAAGKALERRPKAAVVRSAAVALAFRILGPLEVLADGRSVPLAGPRQRAVLAVLLTRVGESVPASRLIDDVWGGRPPASAANVLQGYVSALRKALGANVIQTRGGGYAVSLGEGELDVHRFERLLAEAETAEPPAAASLLRRALSLWRGPALADFADELFARPAAGRLEELRLVALERRIEADLACGRYAEVAGELEALVTEHPLRERLRNLLMLALYRCGRQAEALAAYRAARRTLVDELGIEPSPALQELEKAILRQDPSLDVAGPPQPSAPAVERPDRAILVAPGDDLRLLPLVSIAEALVRHPRRELIVVRLLKEDSEPSEATARLTELRDELTARGLSIRVAAYTSATAGADIVLLATEQAVDLVLLSAPPSLLDDGVPESDLATVLQEAPCDVAVLVPGASLQRETKRPVVVPFGGAEHEWSAVEIAAWMARALGTTLRLVGTSGDRFRGRRDASRLLGRASLIVQAIVGIVAEPVLLRGGAAAVVKAAEGASLLVVGLPEGWQSEGLGEARLEVARAAAVPTLFVRRGLRPGGLAPKETLTRFTWTLEPTAGA
jgi:DNA-binding SARP family transcriptional activator